MARKAPGKAHREGTTLMELAELFPDEAAATAWFEGLIWPGGRHCPRCGSTDTHEAASTSGLPYRCAGCKQTFPVRIGTTLERSRVPLRKWVFAIYLEMTNLKGVSSMKLHRDIGVTQKTAWFMLHRIREAWADECAAQFTGPAEADEVYMGGLRKNMPMEKRAAMTSRGTDGKTAVVGVKDRATKQVRVCVVENTGKPTLQGFVVGNTAPGANVYTDEAAACDGIPRAHEVVNHGVGEYVRGQAHTNGIESFRSMLKRAHKGVCHKLSPKHLQRYVAEFAGRHNLRDSDTIEQMAAVVAGLIAKSGDTWSARRTGGRVAGESPAKRKD